MGLLPQVIRKLENTASEYLQLAEDVHAERQRKAGHPRKPDKGLHEGLALATYSWAMLAPFWPRECSTENSCDADIITQVDDLQAWQLCLWRRVEATGSRMAMPPAVQKP